MLRRERQEMEVAMVIWKEDVANLKEKVELTKLQKGIVKSGDKNNAKETEGKAGEEVGAEKSGRKGDRQPRYCRQL